MDVAIGVDAHKDELAVAAVDGLGRVMAQATFANAPAEHAVLVAWVMSHGPARRVGIEGAGNYAWQLTLALQRAGEDVREVPVASRAASAGISAPRGSRTPRTRSRSRASWPGRRRCRRRRSPGRRAT
jgi:hypothetical protein